MKYKNSTSEFPDFCLFERILQYVVIFFAISSLSSIHLVTTMSVQTANSTTSWFLADLSDDAISNGVQIEVPFLIGRRDIADLSLNCISVSGKHAEFDLKDNKLWINDLKSTNGTFVNGTRIFNATKLKADDIVQFGSMVFRVYREGAESASKRSEIQTLESDIPESVQGRFARLLRVGVVPFFQPVFDLTADEPQLRGYEVLGRGRLPGLCTPDEMFTAAKEMEKTAELSESLRKRGVEVADINFSPQKMIFVNTHPSEISSERLGESLARIRSIHPDRNFTIELPAAILEMPESISVIEAATEGMNIDLSIYGFQAKSIRLGDLQRLAPKVVKFANSLIRDISNADSAKQKLVASIVKMLIELDIQPMAEMVETAAEHEALKRLGFQLAQGFYYGRPTSVDDCLEHQGAGRQVANSEAVESGAQDSDGFSEAQTDEVAVETAETDEVAVETAETFRKQNSGADSSVQWLLSQPSDNYTIQILVTTSKSIAVEYVGGQSEPDAFKIVSKMGTRCHLFSVFHGSFSSRTKAKEVADNFSGSTYCPLVRKFTSIQKEAKKQLS